MPRLLATVRLALPVPALATFLKQLRSVSQLLWTAHVICETAWGNCCLLDLAGAGSQGRRLAIGPPIARQLAQSLDGLSQYVAIGRTGKHHIGRMCEFGALRNMKQAASGDEWPGHAEG
jgi:hypothetical protein